MNEIVIRPEEISLLAEEGGKLVFTPKAEESLVRLVNIHKHLGEVIEIVKQQIIDAGIEIDPSFQGLVGENVTVSYRPFGDKYGYEDMVTAKPFLREKTYIKVDSTLVDAYKRKHKKLPEGIVENDRSKSLVISVSS